VVLEKVPEEEGGQGSAIQSTFRQLGSALGIAVLMTVFFSTLTGTLRDKLVDNGFSPSDATQFSDGVTKSAGAAIGALAQNPETAGVADAAREAMSHALAIGSFLAAGFLVLAQRNGPGVPIEEIVPQPREHDLEARNKGPSM
jgi:hypothetical protein